MVALCRRFFSAGCVMIPLIPKWKIPSNRNPLCVHGKMYTWQETRVMKGFCHLGLILVPNPFLYIRNHSPLWVVKYNFSIQNLSYLLPSRTIKLTLWWACMPNLWEIGYYYIPTVLRPSCSSLTWCYIKKLQAIAHEMLWSKIM